MNTLCHHWNMCSWHRI